MRGACAGSNHAQPVALHAVRSSTGGGYRHRSYCRLTTSARASSFTSALPHPVGPAWIRAGPRGDYRLPPARGQPTDLTTVHLGNPQVPFQTFGTVGGTLAQAEPIIVKPAGAVEDIDTLRRSIDQLLPEVERNPGDAQAVSKLAQYYFRAEDFDNARKWYTRFIDIGAPDADIFLAMLRVAQSMEMLQVPWPEVQDAYLRSWEFRPTRAEPFFGISRHYSDERRYRLGYLFAERAADIRLPEDDVIGLDPDLYGWRGGRPGSRRGVHSG